MLKYQIKLTIVRYSDKWSYSMNEAEFQIWSWIKFMV